METLLLTRRKSQLDLLGLACQGRYNAQVTLPARPSRTPHIQTRFLALEPGGLLVEWPAQAVDTPAISGAGVTVFFEHQDQCYSFRADTRGRAWWCSSGRGQVAAWKLGLPLRIDRRQRRESQRISLAGLGLLPASCTSIAEPQRRFTVQLRNISAGGLSATAPLTRVSRLSPGTTLWTRFELPGESRTFEFVVRVAHLHANKPTDTLVLGCAFCPTEDPLLNSIQLQRIEEFVSRRQHVRTTADNRARPEEHQ